MLQAGLRQIRSSVTLISARSWNDVALHARSRRAILEQRIEEIWNPKPQGDEPFVLDAKMRGISGKKVSKLRTQGLTPCMIIGRSQPEVMVQVEERKIAAILSKGGFVRVLLPGGCFLFVCLFVWSDCRCFCVSRRVIESAF
jgi:hypothetical protein